MSRLEQDRIQSKLKAAIQNHQMLVVKLKNDNQNDGIKKRIAELQDEIKKLSEEHKKMVVKVREHLVKSISQKQSESILPSAPVGSVGQTITAIGQPRIVSFPTQGGATILPMGMVAVPIAHMQKPAVGMSFQPSFTQAANISIIPTGLINTGVNLNFATINGGGGITLNNMAAPLCGPVAQSFPSSGAPVSLGTSTIMSVPPAGGVMLNSLAPVCSNSRSSSSTLVGTTTTTCSSASGRMAPGSAVGVLPPSGGCSGINLNNFTNMTSLILNNSIGSNHPLVINSAIGNKTSTAGVSNTPNTTMVSNNLTGDSSGLTSSAPTACSTLNNCSGGGFLVCPLPSTVNSGGGVGPPSLVLSSSSFPQQPLVQPQLLQQQQQQIIQLIQQQQNPAPLQQQQQPQQQQNQLPPPAPPRLPIKVPQYTALCSRPAVSAVLAQHNSVGPFPSAPIVSQTKMSTTTSASTIKTINSVPHKNSSAPITPLKGPSLTNGNHLVGGKEVKDAKVKLNSAKQAKGQQKSAKESKTKNLQASKEKDSKEPDMKPSSVEDKDKIKFMQALDLYTPEVVKEIFSRRGERKRRTTANPNYSFGFEISRRDRNGSVWTGTGLPVKRARTNKVKAEVSEKGWSDATNGSLQHWDSNKNSRQSDNHDDYCAACSKGGSLLMCSTCRLVYHLDCLNPPLTQAPSYAWSCPQCLVSGKGLANLSSDALKRVNSYMEKKAEKEEEWKKTQKKSREIKTEKGFLERRLQEVNSKIQDQKNLQCKLSKQEQKIQEDLNKLSGFVNMLRESRSVEHSAASLIQANCS